MKPEKMKGENGSDWSDKMTICPTNVDLTFRRLSYSVGKGKYAIIFSSSIGRFRHLRVFECQQNSVDSTRRSRALLEIFERLLVEEAAPSNSRFLPFWQCSPNKRAALLLSPSSFVRSCTVHCIEGLVENFFKSYKLAEHESSFII